MNEKVIELMQVKSFKDLSEEEKQLVLSQMTVAEYKAQRNLLLSAKSSMQEESKRLKVNPKIQQNVLVALQAKQAAKIDADTEYKKNGGFFAMQIPLWSAVAAIFMVFILTTPIFIDSSFDSKNNTPLMATVDTVYIDKIIRDTVEIQAPKDIKEDKEIEQKDFIEASQMNSKKDENESLIENETFVAVELNQEMIQREMEYMESKSAAMSNFENFDFNSDKLGKSLKEDKIAQKLLGVK